MGERLRCPKCKSSDVELYEDNKVYKVKGLFRTKIVAEEKRKLSPLKLGLGLATGGASLLMTGASSRVKKQWYCRDCGYIFHK